MSWRCHPQHQLSGCPTCAPSMARLCRSPTGRGARGNCDRGGWKGPARAALFLQEHQQCGVSCPSGCLQHVFSGSGRSPVPRAASSQSRADGSLVLSIPPPLPEPSDDSCEEEGVAPLPLLRQPGQLSSLGQHPASCTQQPGGVCSPLRHCTHHRLGELQAEKMSWRPGRVLGAALPCRGGGRGWWLG